MNTHYKLVSVAERTSIVSTLTASFNYIRNYTPFRQFGLSTPDASSGFSAAEVLSPAYRMFQRDTALRYALGAIAALYVFNSGLNAAADSAETTIPAISQPGISNVLDAEYISKTDGKKSLRVNKEQIASIPYSDIDLSKDFSIETDRYLIERHDDSKIAQNVGKVLSLYSKALLFDWNMGLGLDSDRSRAVIDMLEKNKNIKGINVRINHTGVFMDLAKLFNDPVVMERNNFLARTVFGAPMTAIGGLQSAFRRSDFYNPLTNTVVLYSNIEAIAAHELGHYEDFQRFDADWMYTLSKALPPVMLYQEGRASLNAKELLAPNLQYQVNRYLVPAFLTYLIMGYLMTRVAVSKAFKETHIQFPAGMNLTEFLKMYPNKFAYNPHSGLFIIKGQINLLHLSHLIESFQPSNVEEFSQVITKAVGTPPHPALTRYMYLNYTAMLASGIGGYDLVRYLGATSSWTTAIGFSAAFIAYNMVSAKTSMAMIIKYAAWKPAEDEPPKE